MSRDILVLGARGFIGRRVVAALAAGGWARPIAASRRPDDGRPAGVATLKLDATDRRALAQALDGVEAVVNCLAGRPAAMRRADAALFSAADAKARPLIIQLSSMAVYGNATGPIDETAALNADQGGYAAAKLAGERLAADYGRAVIFRPGCVYGPGGVQWSGRIARLLEAHRIGDLGAGGDGIANLVHVDDVAKAVSAALAQPGVVGRAFNLAMADAPTWNDYFFAFAKALGAVPISRRSQRRLAIETRLAAPLRIAEILGRRVGLDLPPAIPPSLARLWRQEIRLDSRAAEAALGLAWTPLADGLAETAAWVKGR